MDNLMIFEGKEIEVFELNGQVLFNPYHVGKCLDLGESRVRKSLLAMSANQKVKLTNSDVTTSSNPKVKLTNSKVNNVDFRKLNNAGEVFLTESGVYKLIFKSRKPDAEKFQDWIADEVLPAIRKTGSYSAKDSDKFYLNGTEVYTSRQISEIVGLQQCFIDEEIRNINPAYSVRLQGADLRRFEVENGRNPYGKLGYPVTVYPKSVMGKVVASLCGSEYSETVNIFLERVRRNGC